jgi:hypothetical protein
MNDSLRYKCTVCSTHRNANKIRCLWHLRLSMHKPRAMVYKDVPTNYTGDQNVMTKKNVSFYFLPPRTPG